MPDLRIKLCEEKSCLYILGDDELLEIFIDNNERLKPNLMKFLPKNGPITTQLKELFEYKEKKNIEYHLW